MPGFFISFHEGRINNSDLATYLQAASRAALAPTAARPSRPELATRAAKAASENILPIATNALTARHHFLYSFRCSSPLHLKL